MREYNIIAEAHTAANEGHRSLWKRYYTRLDTAVPRATALAVLGSLQPGQSIVFYHRQTGLEIGCVKMRAGGDLTVKWIWGN